MEKEKEKVKEKNTHINIQNLLKASFYFFLVHIQTIISKQKVYFLFKYKRFFYVFFFLFSHLKESLMI